MQREKEGCKKSAALSIMCILRERAGRMPWSRGCRIVLPPAFSYSIDARSASEHYPAPEMHFYYSLELYTAA